MNTKAKVGLGVAAIIGGYVLYRAMKPTSTLTPKAKQTSLIVGTALISLSAGYMIHGSISKGLQKIPV